MAALLGILLPALTVVLGDEKLELMWIGVARSGPYSV